MCYCSVTVTAILALWLTHRVKHISSRFLPVQQKSPDRPAAPPPLKWCSDIYPGFLSGSVHFFVFTLLFFFRLLISSLGPGRWWDMILLCCLSAIVYSLSCKYPPGESRHCACAGEERCPVPLHGYDWHLSDTPLGSDWLRSSGNGGCLQIKSQPLGGATDSWSVSDSTVRWWWWF